MKSLLSTILLAGMVFSLGCAAKPKSQSSCAPGEEGCSCDNGSCNQGLSCVDDTCVAEPSSGGSSGGSSANAGASGGQGGMPSSSSSSASTKPAPPPASPRCTDVSITQVTQDNNGPVVVDVVGKTKNYFFQPNWWHVFNKQVVDVDGLSFLVHNPAGAASTDNNPAGYPSLYIGGQYSGRTATKGSNLPKQVSALRGQTINTILSTNANSKGHNNYNVAYDVWFKSTPDPLPKSANGPGNDGAFLMVWFFMPSDRQPRGEKKSPAKTVNGVSGNWDVWIDTRQLPPCVSYVNTAGVETLDFDLNNFIQDAVNNGYVINNNMYLYLIFGGFEIWGGGEGLQVKAFCADVPA